MYTKSAGYLPKQIRQSQKAQSFPKHSNVSNILPLYTYIKVDQPYHSTLDTLKALILASEKPAYKVLPSADQANDKHSGSVFLTYF